MTRRRNKSTRTHVRPERDAAGEEEKVMQVGEDAILEDERAAPERNEPEAGASERKTLDADAPDAGEALSESGGETPAEADELPEAQDGGTEEADKPEPRSELEVLREERDTYLDLARRERADFDNYRKRMQREMQSMKRESLANFLKEFFGPLDDLDRVLQESVKNQSFDSLVTGVRIMEENFWRALAKAGVKKIDANGKPFDPNLHEAMAAVPSADMPPNTILEVFENGYKLDDFVLRPARVVVSRAPDE